MPLTEEQKTELLDWVSACQSSYHMVNTANHRFAAIGCNLQENRDGLVDYVESLLTAAAPSAPTWTPEQVDFVHADAKDAARYRWLRDTGDGKPMVLIDSRWYGNQHRAGLDLDAAIDAAMKAN